MIGWEAPLTDRGFPLGLAPPVRPWLHRLLHYEPPSHPCYRDRQREKLLPIDDHDILRAYTVLREEIKREDDLIDQRNSWCLVYSGGIFAGIAAMKVLEGLGKQTIADFSLVLGTALIVSALILSLHCARAVTAARMQIEYLFCTYYLNREAFERRGCFRPFGKGAVHESGIGYSVLTPLILVILWSILLALWLISYAFQLGAGPPETTFIGAMGPAR